MAERDPHPERGPVRDASSVILYRTQPLEVYMVRRPLQARFFPDHWSVPGGAVDAEDGPRGELASFRHAAVRELGEELGVPVGPELAEALVPAGRALTPPFHTIRFNAQYFFLAAPPQWDPRPDPRELAGGGWYRPADVLAAWERREMKLPPPILHVVRTLARPGGFEELATLGTTQHEFPIEMAPGLRIVPLLVATLPPARYTNCYIAGRRDLAIVDPGASGPDLAPLFAAIDALLQDGCRVASVVLTHHHADHADGAREVAHRYNVAVAAHPETATRLERGLVGVTFGQGDELALDEDTTDEIALEAIHTPGHAPGHLAFWVRPHDVLLAGDLVSTVSTILIAPDEGDMAAYMESLERCADRKPQAVFPAHGPPTLEGVKLLTDTLAHRRMRESLVAAALTDEPRTLDDLVPVVYEDTDAALWGLARMSLESHLVKLAAEGRAMIGPRGWRRNH